MSDPMSYDDPRDDCCVGPCDWCGTLILDIEANWYPRQTDAGWNQTFLCAYCSTA